MTRLLADYPQVTPHEVQTTFGYDAEFGCLLRVLKSGYKKLAGTQALERGEVRVFWKSVYWPAHLLIWIHQVGRWPNDMPVHRDGDRSNNRMTNLCLQHTIDRERAEVEGMLDAQRARVALAAGRDPNEVLGVRADPDVLDRAMSGVFAKAMSGRGIDSPK
jgi:hypothetical protein